MRALRFRIRTLMVVVAVAAILLGGWQANERRKACEDQAVIDSMARALASYRAKYGRPQGRISLPEIAVTK